MWGASSLEKTLMLGKNEGRRRRGQQRMRWLDGIIDSVDTNLRKFQEMGRTGKPGMLQSMALQRVGHNWATEQQLHMSSDNSITHSARKAAVVNTILLTGHTEGKGTRRQTDLSHQSRALELSIAGCPELFVTLLMHYLSFLWGNWVSFCSAVSDVEIAHVLNVTLSDKMTCRVTIGCDPADVRQLVRILFKFENRSSGFTAQSGIF